MGLASAARFLVLRSARNRVAAQLRRLRQPKYLLATLAGLLYLWTVFLRRLAMPSGEPAMGEAPRIFLELLLVAGALVSVASGWLFGSSRAAVSFSEAEIQFFFPAPCTRRQVLHYRLLRMLAVTSLSAFVSALIFGRSAARPLYFFLGAWIALGAMGLHLAGASLTRESLAQHGRFGVRARSLTLLAGLAALASLVFWAVSERKPPLPGTADAAAWAEYVQRLLSSGPLAVVLWPIRAPIRVALAPDLPHLLRALPGGLAVLAANYAWAASSGHAFEDAALRAAAERARRLEARRAGRGPAELPARARRAWLPLPAPGRPELALVWKAALATQRALRTSLLPALIGLGGGLGLVAASYLRREGEGFLLVVGMLCAAFAVFAALAGPTMLRIDLRRDLAQADALKALPLSGRQIVVGEMLGPALVLAAFQWAMWLIAFACSAWGGLEWKAGQRISVALAGALVGPAISTAGLTIQNAVALLFPAWIVSDPSAPRGVEALGQRLLTLAGTLVALAVFAVPAGIVGLLAYIPLAFWAELRLAALPFAAAAGAAVILFEVHVATFAMGRLFDRFDVTA